MVRKPPQKLVLSQFVGLPELCSNTLVWDDSTSSLVYLVGNCVLSHSIRTNLQTRLPIGSMKRSLTALAIGEKYCALASGVKSQFPNIQDPEISIYSRNGNSLVSTLCPSFDGRVQSLRFLPGDLHIVVLASNALEFEVWDWAERTLILGKGSFPLPICDISVTDDEVTASCIDVIVSRSLRPDSGASNQDLAHSEPQLWLMGTFKGFVGISHGRELCRDFLYALTASGVLCVATLHDRSIKKWVDLRLEGLGVRAARTRITVFGRKGKARILKAETLEHLGTLPISAGDCIEALWSETQNRLSCVYRNKWGMTIVVWNVRNPRKIKRFREIKYRSTSVKNIVILPSAVITNLIVIPRCSSMIITGNGKLKLASIPAFSKSKLKPLTKRLHKLEVINLTVGESVRGYSIFIACTNGHVKAFSLTWLRIWDSGYLSGRRILHLSAGSRVIDQGRGGTPKEKPKWVVVSTLEGRCCFLDARTGMLLSEVEISTAKLKFGVRLIAGCSKLLTWGQECFYVHRITNEASLELNPLKSPIVDMHETEFVEAHPSLKCFLSAGSTENNVRLWDFKTLNNTRNYGVSQCKGITALKLDPSGSYFAVGCNDLSIRVIDWVSGKEISQVFGHSSKIVCLEWTNAFETLISADEEFCFCWTLYGKLVRSMEARSKELLSGQDLVVEGHAAMASMTEAELDDLCDMTPVLSNIEESFNDRRSNITVSNAPSIVHVSSLPITESASMISRDSNQQELDVNLQPKSLIETEDLNESPDWRGVSSCDKTPEKLEVESTSPRNFEVVKSPSPTLISFEEAGNKISRDGEGWTKNQQKTNAHLAFEGLRESYIWDQEQVSDASGGGELEHGSIMESYDLQENQVSDLEEFSLPPDFPTMEELDGALNQLLEEENFADNLGEFEQPKDIRELNLDLKNIFSEGSSLEICLSSAGEEGMSKIVDHECELQLCIAEQLQPGATLFNETLSDLTSSKKVSPLGELRDCTKEIISNATADQPADLLPNASAVHNESVAEELFDGEKVKCVDDKSEGANYENLQCQLSLKHSDVGAMEKGQSLDNSVKENDVDIEASYSSQARTYSGSQAAKNGNWREALNLELERNLVDLECIHISLDSGRSRKKEIQMVLSSPERSVKRVRNLKRGVRSAPTTPGHPHDENIVDCKIETELPAPITYQTDELYLAKVKCSSLNFMPASETDNELTGIISSLRSSASSLVKSGSYGLSLKSRRELESIRDVLLDVGLLTPQVRISTDSSVSDIGAKDLKPSLDYYSERLLEVFESKLENLKYIKC